MREQPYAQMALDQIRELFTDMGHLARREGVAALIPLIQATDYPLLRQGLEMIRDEISIEQLIDASKSQLEDELRQTEVRHRMVIVGIEAVQMGKKPEDIFEMVKQVEA